MDFKVPDKKRINELEQEVLSFWKENNIFEKSVAKNSADDLYVFYDGPPFISGLPHYGHLLGSIAKDVIPRYQTMIGKRVERVWGWDAHGLAVENKVQKKLGIRNRKEIEDYGLEEFVKECYAYTSETLKEWDWYIDKIGRWVDIKNAYKTTDQTYMESVMWAFKKLYDKGLIYEGVRTSLFCPRCGTPVSNFEVAMDNSYKEVEDPAITVKFEVESKGKFEGCYILAWTTTPWTIPSNRALIVDESSKYVLVESENENFIVASKRLENVFEGRSYKVKDEFLGKSLLGLRYKRLYNLYDSNKNDFKVYSFENMVNMEEGTGIVHSAPGFGEIDTRMGKHYDLSITMAIDDGGVFVEGITVDNPYKGLFYKKANPKIRKDLNEQKLLFKDERTTHRFPYHDRCDTLLIQKAQNSWFVNVEKLKNKLLKNNKNINWVPKYLKEGRFAQGIEQAPDWCISRNRFWATPMPVWENEDGDRIVVGSIEELEKLSNQEVKDLHRPYIDNITIERGGKIYKRREEVLDSWFESGSMPYAQFHYPFENKKKFDDNFPGDFIVEYIAQVRAWFYVMHVLSTALFDKNGFKNVVTTGVMAGDDGKKMSKTYGNYTDPKEVLEKIGGDALRLFLMNSPLMVGENANFDDQELKTKSRKILNPLWNSLKYFLTYANKYNFHPPTQKGFMDLDLDHIMDKWIVVRLNETIKVFKEEIENYKIPDAVEAIEVFVDDLSRWYIRRSRGRISDGDEEALKTLYFVLLNFSKVIAPVTPFMAESIHKRLTDKEESVHLTSFPSYNEKLLKTNKDLLENMESDREVVSKVLAQRDEKSIPIRQPLSTLETTRKVYYEDVVRAEVNVKKIKFTANISDDPKMGAGNNANSSSSISSSNNNNNANGNNNISSSSRSDVVGKGSKGGTASKDEKLVVKLDTKITPELKLEKDYRDFIRKVQSLRKKKGFGVEDRVVVIYPEDESLNEVVAKYKDDIKSKVGADKLRVGDKYEISKKD